MKKRLALLLALLLCCFGEVALAGDALDLSRTGSICIAMRYNGTAVSGGTLTLYRVGEVKESGGDYSFVPTGDFADCGYSLAKPDSAALARALASLAKNYSGTTKTIASDGTVKFDNLELGLYLLVQETAADGYAAVEPFLVTVPMFENGAYKYEVDAGPKVELKANSGDSGDDDAPGHGGGGDEKLPQTGQLNWPVPALATSGVFMFTLGWTLRFRKDGNEK